MAQVDLAIDHKQVMVYPGSLEIIVLFKPHGLYHLLEQELQEVIRPQILVVVLGLLEVVLK